VGDDAKIPKGKTGPNFNLDWGRVGLETKKVGTNVEGLFRVETRGERPQNIQIIFTTEKGRSPRWGSEKKKPPGELGLQQKDKDRTLPNINHRRI